MRKTMHHTGSTLDKSRDRDAKRDAKKEAPYSIDKEKPEFVSWLDKLDEKLVAYRQQKTT